MTRPNIVAKLKDCHWLSDIPRLHKAWFVLCFGIIMTPLVHAQDSLIQVREVPFQTPVADQAAPALPDIQLIEKSTQQGLLIRWAPTNPVTWQMGMRYGYRLERQVLKQGVPSGENPFVPVTESPIKPWPLDEWQSIVNDQTPYTAAAAMAIYGERNAGGGFVDIARDEENRLGYNLLAADFDRKAAEASGLLFLEKDTSANTYGLYRIFIYDASSGYASDTTYQVLGFEKPSTSPGPVLLDPVEEEYTIQVRWYGSRPGFSGYWIERGRDSIHFERLNDQPFINAVTNLRLDNDLIIYTDSVAENGISYYYRVIGIDAFAEESNPSRFVRAAGVDRTPPSAPAELEIREMQDHALVLNWQIEDQTPDLAGFNVYAATDADGNFIRQNETLLPVDVREFVDVDPDQQKTNYYYVASVDHSGNEALSPVRFAITTDELAPQPPQNLQYQIDSSGRLLVEWDAPADKDIRGYLIHYANDANGEFAVVPGSYLTHTYFVDSLNLHSLTERMYFYVIAVDWSYNASEASELLEVKKPDVIPPSPSIFSDYRVSEDTIRLYWLRSVSADVESVHLERRADEGPWSQVTDFSDTSTVYMDTDLVEGGLYEYRLVTKDDDGNQVVTPKTLLLSPLRPFYLPEVESFKVELDKESATLQWSYSQADEYSFILYRSIDTQPLQTYKHLSGVTSWQDTDIKRRTTYHYGIKVKGKDGRESRITEIFTE